MLLESNFGLLLKKKMSRKKFLKFFFSGLAFFVSGNSFIKTAWGLIKPQTSRGRIKKAITGAYDLVVAKGEHPYLITVKAIQSMGGMEKFVKKDSVVLIKPNIAWDRSPEQGANTNPEVVAALIDLCFEAGARRVNVFDHSCNEAKRCYENSGIQQIAKAHKANVFFPSNWNVLKARFAYQSELEDWPIFREALECDTFINVPILKHHGLTELTLSMKNLMGVCSGNRGSIHFNIGKKLVDLTDFINPDLTIIDAFRVLVRHGPIGGNLDDVVKMKTVIVGTDPTLTDVFACNLLEKDPFSVPYIKNAASRNFGRTDLKAAKIFHVTA